MAAQETPKIIGRYEIEAEVGEGAMARVYRARDPEIDRIVAIKVLKHELCLDEEYVSRFMREAKAAGAISHPNIVTIHDVGRTVDTPYITMEFLDEQSLAEVFAENKRLPLKRIIRMSIQLSRALDHAHKRGIVHRDIKPGNILLMEKGETLKITDFGIARRDRADDLGTTLAGAVLGTPRYMSPEQAAGGDVDGRADLFSLGVILYEMLTGRKAFDSNNIATLMLQIARSEPTPIRTLAPDVPTGMQRIVTKLLAKKPQQRYASGAAVAEALERELASIEAMEQDAAHDRFLPMRIKWATIAGGAIALLFFLALGVVYFVEARAIQAQVLDSGASLAKFVAVQTAVPALQQNWVPIEVFVQDASARGSFDYLVVTDHDHVVKASTVKALVGKPFTAPADQTPLVKAADFTASDAALPGGEAAFLFDTPILFQKTEIGRIYLGISKAGMNRVLRSTLILMSALGMVTILAVAGMGYFFGAFLTRPIRLLRQSLAAFGAGDYDRRISETRNDEIGQVFVAYNQMAEHVQTRASRKPDGLSSTLADTLASIPSPARLAAMSKAAADDTEATVLTSTLRGESKA
jgi:serine/threonine-protein kinase